MASSTPMLGHYRDNSVTNGSNPDLQDYYGSLPPPHRLAGTDDPYVSSSYTHSRNSFAEVPSESTRGSHIPAPAPIMSGYHNMADNSPYKSPAFSNSQWLEKQEARSRRSKWIVIGSLVALVGVIVIGVAVGVTVSKNKKSGGSSSSSSSSSGSGSGSGGNSSTTPSGSDPSVFEKDSNLKHSFWGLAYTPEGSQLPDCGNSLEHVIKDIQLISQLTSKIRLYGADCNQTALVLEAIKQTKVDMQVYLGIYNVPTDGGAAYVRQRDIIKEALETYGTDHVAGITVGNEFMLNYLTANGGGDNPNSAVGNAGAQLLIPNITDTRNMLASMSLSKTIPVGNADAGSYFNNEVLAAVDYGMSNVHPWFADVSVDQSATWTWQFFQDNNVVVAESLSNNPKMYIAETGWPTKSSDAEHATNGPSTASISGLQTFMDDFVCQANANGTGYFFFEFADEDWKDKQFGGVEGWWGLFNQDRTLKAVTIPDCHID